MALPKINEVPTYNTTIPSTGQKIEFRPFLVKEQKILLIAMESQDNDQIVQAIANTLQACIQTSNVKMDALTTFDIEYLFTKIRAKSVGEISKVKLKCSSCGDYTDVDINLDEVKVEVDRTTHEIKINDQYTLTLKYPGYKAMGQVDNVKTSDDKTSLTSALHNLALSCLYELKGEEDRFSFADEPREDVINFLDNLTAPQFDMIMDFAINVPALSHTVKFTCEHCFEPNEVTLQGLSNFF